jgi:hypothetical protein
MENGASEAEDFKPRLFDHKMGFSQRSKTFSPEEPNAETMVSAGYGARLSRHETVAGQRAVASCEGLISSH